MDDKRFIIFAGHTFTDKGKDYFAISCDTIFGNINAEHETLTIAFYYNEKTDKTLIEIITSDNELQTALENLQYKGAE